MHFTERVRHVLESEANAIRSISDDLIDGPLVRLSHTIAYCQGKIILTGMGKNGHVGRRAAATLSSTGTPAFFVHPSEAAHGDMGMVSENDILLALSNSGRTREVLEIVEKIKKCYGNKVYIAVITGHHNSPLSQLANLSLSYGEIQEPCPLGLTPSSSLAVMSAILDGLALGIMEMKQFTEKDFNARHWHGYLGLVTSDEHRKA